MVAKKRKRDEHASGRASKRNPRQVVKNKRAEESDANLDPNIVLNSWDTATVNGLWHEDCQRHARKALLKLELLAARDLAKDNLEVFFRIVEHTSGNDYRHSSVQWHPVSKKKEMADPAMIYLAIRADPSTNTRFADDLETDIIGFASFMLTHDDPPYQDRTVAYIYEIHIGEKFQGQGLGRFLIATVERMANGAGVTKAMLTVFTRNRKAIKVYQKLGYIEDTASPSRETRAGVTKFDYMIMSKDWAQEAAARASECEHSKGYTMATGTATAIGPAHSNS